MGGESWLSQLYKERYSFAVPFHVPEMLKHATVSIKYPYSVRLHLKVWNSNISIIWKQ